MHRLPVGIAGAVVALAVCSMSASADLQPNMRAGGRGNTAMVRGSFIAGRGLALDCSNTTVEFRSNGKVVGTAPTRPGRKKGSCAFSARVPAGIELSACAGSYKLAGGSGRQQDLEPMERDRTFSGGREQLGRLGNGRIMSDVASLGVLSKGQRGTARIHVTTEP